MDESIQYVNKCSHLGNELCPTNKNKCRYFMYKYKIYDYKWYESINVIFEKIDS